MQLCIQGLESEYLQFFAIVLFFMWANTEEYNGKAYSWENKPNEQRNTDKAPEWRKFKATLRRREAGVGAGVFMYAFADEVEW